MTVKEGVNAGDKGNDQGRWRSRAPETTRRKSNHVASFFSRCVARTFNIVQFYDQGLIVPSHI